MAIVTRYFSTSAAGAGDGTSWADRAVLFTGGAWSAVITGFDFSSGDSMLAYVGPGTHTITAQLASGSFANPPAAGRPLIFHGCDSSGNALVPASPGWTAVEPAWDDSGLPVLATTTNIATLNLSNCSARLVKFTSTGRQGNVLALGTGTIDWCNVSNSQANTSAGCANVLHCSNSPLHCSGSSYATVLTVASVEGTVRNSRVTGVAGSSGNRNGVDFPSTRATAGLSYISVGGIGINFSSTNVNLVAAVSRCTVAACGSDGIRLPSTASQVNQCLISNNMITGNGGYGINAQSGARTFAANNRLRDNTSGNINGLDNFPTTFDNYTTDSDDATEYENTAGGDYRIKATATIWGQGYGVADAPASAGGGGGRRNRMVVIQ